MSIFGNTNLDVNLGGKRGQKGKKFMNFISASKFTNTIIFMPLEKLKLQIISSLDLIIDDCYFNLSRTLLLADKIK